MIARRPETLRARAGGRGRAARRRRARWSSSRSTVGGGSLPGETLASWGVALAGRSAARLLGDAPAGRRRAIVGRIEDGRVVLDLRTVDPERDAALGRGRRAGPDRSHDRRHRHRRPYRPRQDDAAAGADRHRCRPPARGTSARDDDRRRLRPPGARRRHRARLRRRPRPRQARRQHARRRRRDRRRAAGRGRRRRSACPDARAPRAARRARRRRRGRGRHEDRRGRGRPGGRGGRGGAAAARRDVARRQPRSSRSRASPAPASTNAAPRWSAPRCRRRAVGGRAAGPADARDRPRLLGQGSRDRRDRHAARRSAGPWRVAAVRAGRPRSSASARSRSTARRSASRRPGPDRAQPGGRRDRGAPSRRRPDRRPGGRRELAGCSSGSGSPLPDRTRARLHLGTAAVDAAVGRSRSRRDRPSRRHGRSRSCGWPSRSPSRPGDRFVLRAVRRHGADRRRRGPRRRAATGRLAPPPDASNASARWLAPSRMGTNRVRRPLASTCTGRSSLGGAVAARTRCHGRRRGRRPSPL